MNKIGILQSAGAAADIIERLLADNEVNELFTPVIYSKENKNDKNVGSDLKFGNINAVVVAPGSATEFQFEQALPVYVGEKNRLAVAFEGKRAEEVAPTLTADVVTEKINKAWLCAKRDFMATAPRVALVTDMSLVPTPAADSEEDAAPAPQSFSELTKKLWDGKTSVHGPFAIEEFINESKHQHFDLILTMTDDEAAKLSTDLLEPTRSRILAGIPVIMVSTGFDATYDFANDMDTPIEALLHAVYTAIDVNRSRAAYDEAHRDPLQKLYHERRDDSEKIRFAIPKKHENA